MYGVHAPHEGVTHWSITGCAPDIDLNEEQLNAWSQQMIQLGYECDYFFDGWGTLI
ncbi:MAG: hypothetical protein ICV81_02440 [Flavisolibacter sp.]|nr:hypothetical protein [Flavisolibacter sp.]MBD0352318.1 hypothetical protein [Flavisolibacter sp.]MBD0365164.1 hypothetical protein [Flavisolibacter sp.]